jgi:hypothetical protein
MIQQKFLHGKHVHVSVVKFPLCLSFFYTSRCLLSNCNVMKQFTYRIMNQFTSLITPRTTPCSPSTSRTARASAAWRGSSSTARMRRTRPTRPCTTSRPVRRTDSRARGERRRGIAGGWRALWHERKGYHVHARAPV